MTEETIFAKAIEIEDPQALSLFLEEACTGSPEMRKRIEALISAKSKGDSLLDQPIEIDQTVARTPPQKLFGVGQRVGPYKLLEEIGEGGMGIVYVAEREKPVRQRVALKIIKPGMDSREVIARFEAERQALALMDHPNVAKVLDAGTTEAGLPYFVMEHIKGMSITDYCDDRNLSTKDRLKLFRQVCQGVQHSHQKGVIHRDLKPSNILIAEYDNEPIAKIIDFGVAKALNQSLTDKTLYTKRLNIVGTLQYMSPEQAKLNQRDIDTRSDIYSLGVVLYELLTSRPPFERKTLEDAGLEGMCQMIREKDPPRPSDRLKTMDDQTATDVAKHRSSELQSLSKVFKGDLDWIVMKALDKDRNRRYETANGLAKDIERYLSNENVNASPPTLAYRIWKTYSRNKATCWTAGAFAMLLLIGTIVSLTGWMRAFNHEKNLRVSLAETEDAKQLAMTNAEQANQSARDAEFQRLEAVKQKQVVEAVNSFFNEEFLKRVAPSGEAGRGKDATLLETIELAIEKLDGETRKGMDPLVEASIRKNIGFSFSELGRFEFANDQLKVALDRYQSVLAPTDERLIEIRLRIAENLIWSTDVVRDNDAHNFIAKLKDDSAELLGPDHEWTLWSRFWFASTARGGGTPKEFLEIASLARGTKSREKLLLATALLQAANLSIQKDRQAALELAEEAEKQFDDHNARSTVSELWFRQMHGSFYFGIQDWERCAEIYSSSLPKARRILGPRHPITLNALNNLGAALIDIGEFDRAISLLEELAEITADAKAGSPTVGFLTVAKHNLAICYLRQNQFRQAWETAKSSYTKHSRGNNVLSIAASASKAGGFHEEFSDFMKKLTQEKIEQVDQGALSDRQFAFDLREFALKLNGLGQFKAAIDLSSRVNDSIEETKAHQGEAYDFDWMFSLGRAELELGEQKNDMEMVRNSIATLIRADQLAAKERKASGLKNFSFKNRPFGPRQFLARAYMRLGELEKAETAIFDAWFDLTTSSLQGPWFDSELKRLFLLTGRSNGEPQKRFVERAKQTAAVHSGDLEVIRIIANILLQIGEPAASLQILDQIKPGVDAKQVDRKLSNDSILSVRAQALLALGKLDDAEQFVRDLRHNSDIKWAFFYDSILGEIQRQKGDLDIAEKTLVRALYDGYQHGATQNNLSKAGQSLVAVIKTRLEKGEDPREFYCYQFAKTTVESGSSYKYRYCIWIPYVLNWSDEFELAEKLARKIVERGEMENNRGPEYKLAFRLLGETLLGQEKFNEAVPYLRRSFASVIYSRDCWAASLQGMIGDCQLGMKDFAEAEENIVGGFQALERSYYSGVGPDYYRTHLLRRANSCIQLYEQWNKVEPSERKQNELARWRKKLSEIKAMFARSQAVAQ